jgi:sulfonate transport system substrate-binding protein
MITNVTDSRHALPLRLAVALLALALAACGSSAPAANTAGGNQAIDLRIGYQRGGVWSLLKAKQTLEQHFGQRVNITWTLFPSGPPLLEAMNANSIDIGSTGETPPIFAQAAGTPLRYVAYQDGDGSGSAIIVPKDSPIRRGTDLKGKKVVFTKASSANLLIVKALQKIGLTYADIEPVFLQPPEARAAFQGGSVDAWVIWNPFLAAAKQELGARELINGADVARTKGYVLAVDTFVDQHPDILYETIEAARQANEWGYNNRDQYAQILEKETGVKAAVWQATFSSELLNYNFIDDQTIAYQQDVATIFFDLKLIPKRLDIRASAWVPEQN